MTPNEIVSASQPGLETQQVESLIAALLDLRESMLAAEMAAAERLANVHADQRPSACNLIHYMVLRARDIRPLQEQLAALGLSSLGRTESHVLASVDAVLSVLYKLADRSWQIPHSGTKGMLNGRAVLVDHSVAVLGAPAEGRNVRIMVTMPPEAAADYALVRDLLAAGMDIMRINCAHDDPEAWASMVDHFRRAERELGRTGRILMDLPGPKLRTGPIATGPEVVKWRPRRDDLGQVLAPARIWLTSTSQPEPAPSPADAILPIDEAWLARILPGDTIIFRDARGARRRLTVVTAQPRGCWVEAQQTAYVTSGQCLSLCPSGGDDEATQPPYAIGHLGMLPARPQKLHLHRGDTLIVTNNLLPGEDAKCDAAGGIIRPAHIGCTLPDAFAASKPGDAVWFDDGKIGGTIRAVGTDAVTVEITQARPGGETLGADKGINVPDSDLQVSALTATDIECLPLIVQHADLVGCSFVHTPDDVTAIQDRLTALGGSHLGIVLKIETRTAFERLPSLLLAAMRNPTAGVMIARGDLAIECGFERLAEVQEEILFISEAAHMPVIWATQVLEKLAQDGLPSRAEITDAAMAERAECVMLNKGPYILDAVRTLDNILRRMQDHQKKKSAMLRQLSISQGFFSLG